MKLRDYDKKTADEICHSRKHCDGCPFCKNGETEKVCLKELVAVNETYKERLGYDVINEQVLDTELEEASE